MGSLAQPSNYGTMNKTDYKTMGYYMVNYLLYIYTLQEETTCCGEISTCGAQMVKYQYLSYMKKKIKWYL